LKRQLSVCGDCVVSPSSVGDSTKTLSAVCVVVDLSVSKSSYFFVSSCVAIWILLG